MSSWSHAHHVGALGAEHTHHPEGYVLHADLLPDRGFSLEEFADKGLSDQTDLVGVEHVPFGKRLAVGQAGPVPDVQKFRGGAEICCGTQLRLP